MAAINYNKSPYFSETAPSYMNIKGYLDDKEMKMQLLDFNECSEANDFFVLPYKSKKKHNTPDDPHKIFQNPFDPRIDVIYVSEKKRTIVVKWLDGKTTKVKARKGEKFDVEYGVSMAILKRFIISHHHLQKSIQALTKYSDKKDGNDKL